MPNDLIALIRTKQTEIAKLKAELDEAKALLTGEVISAEIRRGVRPQRIRRSAHGRPAGAAGPAAARGVDALPDGSSAYHAAVILMAAGKPLHVTALLAGIEGMGHKVQRTTLVGSLSRWVKRRVFYRAGPNVFGLIEMRDSK